MKNAICGIVLHVLFGLIGLCMFLAGATESLTGTLVMLGIAAGLLLVCVFLGYVVMPMQAKQVPKAAVAAPQKERSKRGHRAV
ncbi:MAG: hypothetical protein ACK5L3_08685 [Oscillospiraceae bacterium]